MQCVCQGGVDRLGLDPDGEAVAGGVGAGEVADAEPPLAGVTAAATGAGSGKGAAFFSGPGELGSGLAHLQAPPGRTICRLLAALRGSGCGDGGRVGAVREAVAFSRLRRRSSCNRTRPAGPAEGYRSVLRGD